MFLPQVVKSAHVVTKAFEILKPHFPVDLDLQRKKMIVATVKGDIHDIGKNIVISVLQCNNIEVIDLGVDVSNEAILSAIESHKPDFVGVSGLISPSLKHMEDLARLMSEKRHTIPLFVGGAATSKRHTILKLYPLYRFIFHTTNASHMSHKVSKLITDTQQTIDTEQSEFETLTSIENTESQFVSLEEARSRRKKHIPESYKQPPLWGLDFYYNLPLEAVVNNINWGMYLSLWGFKGEFNELISDSEVANQCYQTAVQVLYNMIHDSSVVIRVKTKFFDAYSEDETIILDNKYKFTFPREHTNTSKFASLADFVPPKEYDTTAKVGLFAISVHDLNKPVDRSSPMAMVREGICMRFTEATSVWLQDFLSVHGKIIRPAFGYNSCPDHSYKKLACDLLNAEIELGITLTESYALIPTTSLCGMLINHPNAFYPVIYTDPRINE